MTDARVILLVEDDSAHADLALRALERCDGLTVLVVDCVEQAREVLARQHVDLVLADLRLPDGSGLDLLQQEIPVVVQTSQGDESRAVAAMKGGALDYCVKSPEMFRDLPIIVERALNAGRNLFERRRAERSLRESDERFRQLAANIPEVFWLFDLASRQVEYASPAWESVYGPVPQTWEGRLQYAHADDAAPLWALGPSDGDLFRVVEGTSLRWVEERRFWINDAQAKTSRLACLAVDVTRRRELEASLSHTQKMHAIGQLAGGVAHDFNNMLAAILSAAEELSESKADPELCELIISASMRASELTRNLLSFSRRGKMELRVLDMHDVVRQAVTLLSRSINPNVRLITSLDATRAEVLGDPSQLESAILNLGLNARDALPPRGGDICFSSRELVFDEASSERKALNLEPAHYLALGVRDTGQGIAEDTLPHIFEPFFTTKDRGRGTGLGLAAVYGTVLEHHGAVTVRSKVGEGAEFTLLLPLAAARHTVVPDAYQTPSPGRGVVLVVDDQPLVLRAAQRMVERIGYTVVSAPDGEAGWQAFQAHRHELVALVTDVSMPKLGGRELVGRVREAVPDFPCVLCTGYADAEQDLPAPVINKPFSRQELARVLSAAITGRKHRHE